jgi:hypothetical protein
MAGTNYPARGVPALLMAIGFVAFGIYLAGVGRVMWSDSHNPHVVPQIDHRRCWTSTGDSGSENLCDLVVTYEAADKNVTTTMKAVDAGGIQGATIRVSYNPSNVSDASGPENDSETAFLVWAFAALLVGFGGWLSYRVLSGTSRTPVYFDLLEHRI